MNKSNRFCVPIDGDQPSNAMYIANVHSIGYELFNVRSGPGLRPILRKNDYAPPCTIEAAREEFIEVLINAFGADGQRKRENIVRMRDEIRKSWAPGGKCWEELEKLHALAH